MLIIKVFQETVSTLHSSDKNDMLYLLAI